jgi:hypothetical protein
MYDSISIVLALATLVNLILMGILFVSCHQGNQLAIVSKNAVFAVSFEKKLGQCKFNLNALFFSPVNPT